MFPKLTRVVLTAAVATGLWLVVPHAAGAGEHNIEVTGDAAKCDKTWGPPCYVPGNGTITPVDVGDKVTWHVTDGTHTVTPVDSKAFKGSDDVKGPDGTFSVTFDKVGVFAYYCTHHGKVDDDGKTFHGMWGKIDVRNPGAATTTTAPSTTTAPPPAPGAGPPPAEPPPPQPPPPPGPPAAEPPPPPPPPAPQYAPAPAPAPARAPAEDGRKKSEATTTTLRASDLPPLPDLSAPGPAPAGNPTTTTVGAVPPPPQGNAVAVLDHPRARRRKAVLIVTGLGVGALTLGGAGWKYAHRSSRYWPA